MRKQPKAPKGKKSQILIFNWLYSTEASWGADMGKKHYFSVFAIFSCLFYYRLVNFFHLAVLDHFLWNYLHRTILIMSVSYIYMYPLKLFWKQIFWLHFEKLITDKWTRPFWISPNILMLQEIKYTSYIDLVATYHKN